MRNAFASIVQARPCPTFGRPVRLRDRSLDYGPAVLLMPFGFHLAVDTLPSGYHRPAKHYPRFWIWHPSSGCQRDLNPPNQCAAQRTLWIDPTTCTSSSNLVASVPSTPLPEEGTGPPRFLENPLHNMPWTMTPVEYPPSRL